MEMLDVDPGALGGAGRLDAVGRLGGTSYSGTRDVFHLTRPTCDDVRGRA